MTTPDRFSPERIGKRVERGRFALEPEVVTQGAVEFEAVSRPGDERPLEDEVSAVIGVPGLEADPVAEPEATGVGQCDLLVIPVGIGGEFGRGRTAP